MRLPLVISRVAILLGVAPGGRIFTEIWLVTARVVTVIEQMPQSIDLDFNRLGW